MTYLRQPLIALVAIYLLLHSVCGLAGSRDLEQLEHHRGTLSDRSPSPLASDDDLWVVLRNGGVRFTQAPATPLTRFNMGRAVFYALAHTSCSRANDPHQVLALPTAVNTAQGPRWLMPHQRVAGIDPMTLQSGAPPRVRIESLVVDGETVSLKPKPELQSKIQQLVINYNAHSLSTTDGLLFLYRLDGYDYDWHIAGRQREAIYTSLPAGDYRFRVRALNQNGVPSAKDAELDFSIAPTLHRHPIFLVFAGGALLCVLHLIYSINMRLVADRLRTCLKERHSERERIARELHDTLLQGIHGLILHVQAVSESLSADQPARGQLEKALDRADQMLNEGRDRVYDLRNLQHDSVDLLDVLRNLEQSMTHQDISYLVVVVGESRVLHPVVGDELYQLAREAVGNAFRHAHATNVRVELDYSPRKFEMRVIDNGCGILPDYLQATKSGARTGLKSMYEHAAKIGGTLNVHSAPGRGSHVQLTLAAPLAYRQKQTHRRDMLHWERLSMNSRRGKP